jgi:L-lysine exporter family protein LysE/ArgO
VPSLLAALAGLGLGLSLIVAIGAQNAFVLRQGLLGRHVLPVVLLCIASDATLIVAGVGGGAVALTAAPWLLPVIRVAGAVFLLWYALAAARRALRPSTLVADGPGDGGTRRAAVVTCLLLTWLNPHVYLDTVVLLGGVAQSHGGLRWAFAAGAATASAGWFLALGYGARLLRPAFARPAAWRVLDAVIALVMAGLAVGLLQPCR